MLDCDTLNWAGSRLEMIGLDPALLPPLRWPHEEAGLLRPRVATRFGLSEDVRIIVGAGDMFALITGAPPMRGQVTCSLGTSSMVFTPLALGHTVADSENRLYVYPLLPYSLLGGVSSGDRGRPAMGLAGIVRGPVRLRRSCGPGDPDAGRHRGADLPAFSFRRAQPFLE